MLEKMNRDDIENVGNERKIVEIGNKQKGKSEAVWPG